MRSYTDEQVEKLIKENISWRQVCFGLGLKYAGGNVSTLKKIAKDNQFDFSHFKGQGWNIGGQPKNAIPLKECLVNGYYIKSTYLKSKLIKASLLQEKCSICDCPPKWQGKDLTLELDHIDGDYLNNKLSNLRILCPNCHSQTATFRGRKNKC